MADVEKQALASMNAGYGDGGYHHGQEEKKGEKCFGCCDVRRAVIIISILSMCFSAISLAMLAGFESLRSVTASAFDDDFLLETIRKSYVRESVITALGLVFSACSLVGAIKYNINLVAANIVWLLVEYLADIIIDMRSITAIEEYYSGTEDIRMPWPSFIISAIITCLIIYPMVRFVREVKVGIMSPETYAREEYSCCCM